MKIQRGNPWENYQERKKKAKEKFERQSKRYIKAKTFVNQYLIDCNAVAAWKRCGYSTGNDSRDALKANNLLARPDIQQAIYDRQNEVSAKLQVTQEKVLAELAVLAFANIRDVANWDGRTLSLKPFESLTREQTAILSGIKSNRNMLGEWEVEFKTPSSAEKRAALIDLGKNLGLFFEDSGKQRDPEDEARKIREALREMDAKTDRLSLVKGGAK